MDAITLTGFAAAAAAVTAAVSAGLGLRRERARAESLGAALDAARTALAREEEKTRHLESARAAADAHLEAQAARSAQIAADQLLARASETFRAQDQISQARLEAQLKPVAETLVKFEERVKAMEADRVEATGGLKEQIAALLKASEDTQAEARRLSGALRRGAGVQGRWGEQTLRNVLETAGLNDRFDFLEQFSVETEEGRRRPDVKVRLPGGGVFVIDAKCSLTAFLESLEAADDVAREGALQRHTASVRAHVTGLAAKAYWDQFQREGSPDFVAMFIPGDGFLAAALDRAPDLMTEAMDKRVVIVTPTTLFALCKAVAYGWRVEAQARNAEAVARLGKELHKRLAVMGGHVGGVGKALTHAVEKYNAFVGSLETQVLTSARRFEELEVDQEGKEIAELAPVEQAVRPLAKLAAATPPQDPAAVLTA